MSNLADGASCAQFGDVKEAIVKKITFTIVKN